MRRTLLLAFGLAACTSTDGVFEPKSVYPPDPYVKGYADPEDCLGGEDLMAISLPLPEYPARPYRTGRQGWVILRLDIAADGTIAEAEAERAVPKGLFEKAAEEGAMRWRFEPPASGGLRDCRLLVSFRLGEVRLGG